MLRNQVQFSIFDYIPTPKSAKWITKAMEYKFNIAEGQIRSGKDCMASVAFVERIIISPEDLFLVGAVSVDKGMRIVGKYVIDYFNTQYNEVGKAYKTLYNNADSIRIEYKGRVKYIVFAGGYTKNSQEMIQGDTYGGVYLTEINLLNQDFISQCQKRIAASKNGFIYGTLNPKGENHWFYQTCLKIWYNEQLEDKNKKWLNFNKFTLEDNPILTEEMIKDAKRGYDPDSVFYKRDILGLRVDPESQIYNIRDYNILEDFNPNDYLEYIIVCDQGESISASAFVLAGLKYSKELRQYQLDILKNYYYINDGKKNAQVKLFADTAKDLRLFMEECKDLLNKFPKQILIDQDIEFYRNVEREFRVHGYASSLIKYVTKDDIETRIKSGCNLLYKNKLRIYKECKEVIDDFKNAVYDTDKIEKKGKFERLKQYTNTGHLDSIDAVEYAFTYYKSKLYI